MWKLIIEDDEGKRTPLPLVRDEYTVGREADNTVRLTERNISRKHATLKKNGKGWVLADLESYNGSYVNGARVAGEHPLAHGDIVQLGDYRLEVADDAQAATEPETAGASTVPMPKVGAAQVKPDRLIVLVGPAPGQEFPLNAERLTIGRAEDASVCIPHSSVSRLHAEVHALGAGRYEIVDKGSANGVRVNGSDLRRGLIEAGDVIELGDIKLKFVGAGQAFRPGAEASQQIAAVSADQPAISAAPTEVDFAPRKKGGLGKMMAFGAVAGALVVVGIVALRPAQPSAGAVSTSQAPSEASALFDDAKKLAAAGDLDQAHAKLAKVPENSSLRDSSEYKAIETRWADALFARAEGEADPATKRGYYTQIERDTSLTSDRRKRAADAIQALDANGAGTDIAQLPSVATRPTATAAVAAAGAPDSTPGKASSALSPSPFPAEKPASTRETPTERPTVAAKENPTAAPPSTSGKSVAELASQGRDGEAKIRPGLEAKVWSGRGSVDDIRLLRAICRHMGDRACADRASALLAAKTQ